MGKEVEKEAMPRNGSWGEVWRGTEKGSNWHSYFTHPMWLPDSSGLIFLSDRGGSRECFLLEWPSGKIRQLTDCGPGIPVVSLSGESILFVTGPRVVEQDIWGEEDRRILCTLPGDAQAAGMVGQTCDGRHLVLCCRREGESLLVKVPRRGGPVVAFHRDSKRLSHLLPCPSIPNLLSVAWTLWKGGETPQRLWLVNSGGGGIRALYDQPQGELVTHEAWSGDGSRLAFTAGPFTRRPGSFSVKTIEPIGEHVETVAVDGDYWHCCPNHDCSKVVADTNWPDDGIKIIETSEGRVRTLCYSNSREAHPHPCFSPDGSKVVYTSDVSGRNQVYIAELP